MSSQSQATYLEGHILRRFTLLKKVGSGAYGHVWKVQEKNTRKVYALKKIFDAFQHATDAQRTYRQIEILRQLSHPNIIKLHQTMKAENNKDVYLLFQFMQADLHNVVAQGILKDVHIRFIVYQLAKALKYLHSGSVIHRDLKPSNVLVNSNCVVKLCDFGLVRSLNHGKDNGHVLTEGVATRWYRSPEVLLGSKSYSTPADVWSFGCIIYEIIVKKPLFSGSCTLDQIQKICTFTGYPSQQDIDSIQSQIARSMIKQMKIPTSSKPSNYLKDIPQDFIQLLQKILVFNPKKRITIDQILRHQTVRAFHKEQEEICCQKNITTSIDDNKKLTVEQYRKLIYGVTQIQTKSKALSSSLGAGLVSPKYQPLINKSTITFSSNRSPEIKKYNYERVKPAQTGYNQQTSKKIERPSIKHTKSAILKVENNLMSTFQKKISEAIDAPNRQEIDCGQTRYQPPQRVFQSTGSQLSSNYSKNTINFGKTDQNKYHTTNTLTQNLANCQSSINFQQPSHWRTINKPISTNQPIVNDMKAKVLQFRSPKYTHVPRSSFQAKNNLTETTNQTVGKDN